MARAQSFLNRLKYYVMRRLHLSESDRTIFRDADRYWNGAAGAMLPDYAHWEGAGTWADQQRWLALGETHLALAERLSGAAPAPLTLDRVVEWGSGGGANAVVFARRANRYYGVEIADANLQECARVLENADFSGFVPVKITTDSPESALAAIGEPCDFFLCTYVFELLPGKTYGERILGIARQALRPGGAALIQIRYDDGSRKTEPKRFDYMRNAIFFTSYGIHEFWLIAETAGFTPVAISLVPTRGRLPHTGAPYAYFYLYRP